MQPVKQVRKINRGGQSAGDVARDYSRLWFVPRRRLFVGAGLVLMRILVASKSNHFNTKRYNLVKTNGLIYTLCAGTVIHVVKLTSLHLPEEATISTTFHFHRDVSGHL